ncbi:sulfatase [Lutibacter citreus]|uniref:sulfatase n=1 Tax=Lutibacter citreus TaxID=2138210 RepID=UPI000DBE7B2A|nr:sulfatase [Lutibacter citreus]
MKNLLLIMFLFSLMACNSEQEKKINKPNILFILADDLGYSDLSCMGSEYYETPNIDKIAKAGMVFTDGYAGCQVCSPSRATILTGQFTARHGITDWIGSPSGEEWRANKRYSKLLPAEYNHQLPDKVLTLPEAFRQEGYKTFFAGKWHLGELGSYPEDHGFDINKGGWERGSPRRRYFSPYRNPTLEDGEPGENLSMRLANETINFMKENKNKPFLAYLSFYAVHSRIQCVKDKWAKYRDKAEKMGIAEKGFEEGDLLPMRLHQDNPIYAGLIETMDDAVGEVLKALKENGLDENTIVVFTSDNGGVTSGDDFSSNCLPLKGGKGYQWEGGIRIPYIVNVPWMNFKGQRNNTPVAGSDFYPTLLDLAGLPLHPEAHIDGESFAAVLKGETLNERPLYWHYPHYGNQGGRPVSIMRKGDWKLIHYWEDGHNELYNLTQDIHEDNNLIAMEKSRGKQMAQTLISWLDEVGANYAKPDPLHNEEVEQEFIKNNMASWMSKIEKIRSDAYAEDWEPDPTWWGSIQTKD